MKKKFFTTKIKAAWFKFLSISIIIFYAKQSSQKAVDFTFLH